MRWTNRLVCSQLSRSKGNDKQVRLITDYTKLNKYFVGPVHPFPLVSQIVQFIPASSTCFAKLDATHGYFQLALTKEVSALSTFLLSSGWCRYLQALMSFSASSDEWCQHSDLGVEGLPCTKKIVDDILIWAPKGCNQEYGSLKRCGELNVTISKSKFEIGDKNCHLQGS